MRSRNGLLRQVACGIVAAACGLGAAIGIAQETHFSPLTQIAPANASQLGLAWEFNDFVVRGRTHRGNEASPIVTDGVMYFSGPWSVVYALDARSGKLLWKYDPKVDGNWARRACCDVVNRGI